MIVSKKRKYQSVKFSAILTFANVYFIGASWAVSWHIFPWRRVSFLFFVICDSWSNFSYFLCAPTIVKKSIEVSIPKEVLDEDFSLERKVNVGYFFLEKSAQMRPLSMYLSSHKSWGKNYIPLFIFTKFKYFFGSSCAKRKIIPNFPTRFYLSLFVKIIGRNLICLDISTTLFHSLLLFQHLSTILNWFLSKWFPWLLLMYFWVQFSTNPLSGWFDQIKKSHFNC